MDIECKKSETMGVRKMIEVINPATGMIVGSIPDMEEADIDRAIDRAQRSFHQWSTLAQMDRSCALERFILLLNENAESLGVLLSQETGKPLAEARGEMGACSVITKAYCERANHMYGNCLPRGSQQTGGLNDIVFTRREPIGVFACIIPFNFPIAMFAHKVVPALVVGNTVIMKPPTDCPLTLLRLVELAWQAGVPKDAIQAVTGRGSGAAGSYLSGHPGLQAISMTGSQKVGTDIYRRASTNLARVFLELGANDAFIVMDDADLDLAVSEAMQSRLLYAGQVCCGSKRFLVHKDCADRFVEKLKAALQTVRMGDPMDPASTMGCLISENAAHEVEQMVQLTLEQGAICEFGGQRKGAFFQPTVLTHVTSQMDVAKDMEIFGPVFPIIAVNNAKEAVEIANQCQYGLSGAVFSADAKRAMSIAQQMQTATVVVNGGTDYRTPELAFGGYKKSGIGREGCSRTLDEMTQEKNYVLKNIFEDLD